MSFLELAKERRSVRSYSDKPVSDETLDYILEAARLAPSASNRQPWKFVVVRDEETRQQLAKASRNQRFVGEAPVVIAAVGLEPDRTMTCDVPAYAVDVSIAVDHMTLAAADKGLGTCWIGAFNQDMVRDILSIPENCKAVTIFPLGYPADEPKAKQRKDMDEIVTCERFE